MSFARKKGCCVLRQNWKKRKVKAKTSLRSE